eukprot:TRINITY_DN18627_c0_g1_i2.p1 TRINITY_DN18627_c0_g1~~TRINITY_DN18627_c0_g1_i2.p1  ORF type:complete len:486 (+),score=123.08 TRINITY_DN18627_c0_g1_i2:105-1562(+)
MCIRDRYQRRVRGGFMMEMDDSPSDLGEPLLVPTNQPMLNLRPHAAPKSSGYRVGRPTFEQSAECTLYSFGPKGDQSSTKVTKLAELTAALDRPVEVKHFRWIYICGDVGMLMVRELMNSLQIHSSLLSHVLDEQLLDFPASSICISKPDCPQNFCLSVGAPIPHADTVDTDNDIAKIWVHSIMVGSTLVSFTKSSGMTLGMFGSQKKMHKFWDSTSNLFVDRVLEGLGQMSPEHACFRWHAIASILHTLQQSFFEPAAYAQKSLISRVWEDGSNPSKSQSHTQSVLLDIYTIIQRSTVMLTLGNAFKDTVSQLIGEGFEALDVPDGYRPHFKGDLQSIGLAVNSTVRDLETQTSMIQGVEQAWAKRQELMHLRVNTLLAMVATVFLPLTFLAGVYGMNFDNPDNGTQAIPLTRVGKGFTGYIIFWGLCLAFAGTLGTLFYHMNWFSLVGLRAREAVKLMMVVLCSAATFPVIEVILHKQQDDTL